MTSKVWVSFFKKSSLCFYELLHRVWAKLSYHLNTDRQGWKFSSSIVIFWQTIVMLLQDKDNWLRNLCWFIIAIQIASWNTTIYTKFQSIFFRYNLGFSRSDNIKYDMINNTNMIWIHEYIKIIWIKKYMLKFI